MTFLLLLILDVCGLWQKSDAVTLAKPVLTGPSVALVNSPEDFYCISDEIPLNISVLYQLFKEGDQTKPITEYSAHSKQEAKFVILARREYDGNLRCKASGLNVTGITPSFSYWHNFQVLVPVEGAHIKTSPSTGDLWEGDSLCLQCNVSKGTYVKCNWHLNDKVVQPHHDNRSCRLNIQRLSTGDSGKYICVASNQFNNSFFYNSTDEIEVHVKEYVSKPEISYTVVKTGEGKLSTYVKCQTTKGSRPIKFKLFLNNEYVTEEVSERLNVTFVIPIALEQVMGTVQCQADNGRQTKSKQLYLTVVMNEIPAKVAVVVFTCFSILIVFVFACCVYGVVLRKRQSRIYILKEELTELHNVLDDTNDYENEGNEYEEEKEQQFYDLSEEEEETDLYNGTSTE
ncbi:uncharacterized protein si:dkey-93h22.7 isoform X2 [Trichomycterus rosablanca]|uniref:uncharacterized protein si:dkey-93h22.7 isoform X2 n=1 Tax=Trichomycterus rosablanca TaxID=2290929 RepID=UPI002F36076C